MLGMQQRPCEERSEPSFIIVGSPLSLDNQHPVQLSTRETPQDVARLGEPEATADGLGVEQMADDHLLSFVSLLLETLLKSPESRGQDSGPMDRSHVTAFRVIDQPRDTRGCPEDLDRVLLPNGLLHQSLIVPAEDRRIDQRTQQACFGFEQRVDQRR
jgi:hypothetical protein